MNIIKHNTFLYLFLIAALFAFCSESEASEKKLLEGKKTNSHSNRLASFIESDIYCEEVVAIEALFLKNVENFGLIAGIIENKGLKAGEIELNKLEQSQKLNTEKREEFYLYIKTNFNIKDEDRLKEILKEKTVSCGKKKTGTTKTSNLDRVADEGKAEKIKEIVSKGNKYYDMGQFKEAIKAYNSALELNDNQPNVWSDLGVMLRKDGQPQKAIEAFENATSHDPYFLNAYLNMGIIFLYDLDNKEKAFINFNIILEQNPEYTLPNNITLSDYMKKL